MKLALGIVETKGLIGAVEAADAMLKAADVTLVSKEYSTGAMLVIKVLGDTASVEEAVRCGAEAAERTGELVGTLVIPNPSDEIMPLIYSTGKKGKGKKKKSAGLKKNSDKSNQKRSESDNNISNKAIDLSKMSVPQLRKTARKISKEISDFPLSGTEISVSKKDKLLKILEEYKDKI